jgi:hypothetical protein
MKAREAAGTEDPETELGAPLRGSAATLSRKATAPASRRWTVAADTETSASTVTANYDL